MKILKSIWAWLDGKKRSIALIYWTVLTPCLPILWPTGVPANINKVYLITGIVLSAVGLGHAVIRNLQEAKTAVVESTTPPPETPAQ